MQQHYCLRDVRSYAAWKEEYDGSCDAPIDEESMWANLAYFLQAVVPVAEEAGVRLALHPEDPPVLESLGQAAHITSTLDQYERVFALAPGRANAMTFCQGCVTEMGEKGRGGSVADAIRRMVAQDKVCFVHFRAPHPPILPCRLFASPPRCAAEHRESLCCRFPPRLSGSVHRRGRGEYDRDDAGLERGGVLRRVLP